jgi:hypothetical protein
MQNTTLREFAGISPRPYELVTVTMLGDGTLKGRMHGLPITGEAVSPDASRDEVALAFQLTDIAERQPHTDWIATLERLRTKASDLNGDLL